MEKLETASHKATYLLRVLKDYGETAYLKELGEQSRWLCKQEENRRENECEWLANGIGTPPIGSWEEHQKYLEDLIAQDTKPIAFDIKVERTLFSLLGIATPMGAGSFAVMALNDDAHSLLFGALALGASYYSKLCWDMVRNNQYGS